jgi:hypothetical protein
MRELIKGREEPDVNMVRDSFGMLVRYRREGRLAPLAFPFLFDFGLAADCPKRGQRFLPPSDGSIKYDRLFAVAKDAMLQVPLDRAGQNNPLQVPALLSEILHLIAV